jgi:pimeloyl-ACP methyl ester carboxylesterase
MRNYWLPFLILGICFSSFSQDKLKALDKDLTTVSYPFKVNIKTITSQEQELKMAYLDVSPKKTNGKTVVLLHGKNFNAAYWEKTIKELNKKGFRVIAPDQIGFGKSAKPEHYQYSFSQLATNTKSILDSLNIRTVIVLGHSMGGMLATRFALQYPEMTEKLILENPIGLEDYKTMIKYKTVDENYQAELKNTAESIKNYQLKNYYDNKWKGEYDRWVNLLAGWTLHKDYPIIAKNAALTTDMIITQPVVYEFKNIVCPTLLIIGTRDRTALGKDTAPNEVQYKMGLYNQLGKKTQQAIPNAKLVELDNVGHLPHIEAFDKFIKPLVQFLGE